MEDLKKRKIITVLIKMKDYNNGTEDVFAYNSDIGIIQRSKELFKRKPIENI